MNIRNKLILMLAIPVAALLIVALWGFQSQSAQSERNEEAAETASSVVTLQNLAGDVAAERLALIRVGLAADDPALATTLSDRQSELEEAIAVTDSSLAAIASSQDSLTGTVGESVDAILGGSRSASMSDVETVENYSDAISGINDVIVSTPLTGLSADSVLAVQAIQQAREAVDAQEDAWIRFFGLQGAEDAELDADGEAAAIAIAPDVIADLTARFGHVDFVSTVASDIVYSNGVAPMVGPTVSSSARGLGQFRALASEDLFQNSVDDLDIADVVPLLLQNRSEWNEAIDAASVSITTDIATEGEQILDDRSLFTLLAVLGTLLFFTLIYVIGRSILGPLGRLMGHAEVMTEERLPFAVAKLRTLGASDELPEIRPIPKEANDEVGSLVDAFNEVQETAIKVATDQARSRRNVAEMFVSLGRRNQQLNHRMINLISDLEQDEQDAETLQGLYQLDHLATRMRRNAESLLVLAGNRSPRQWSRPVPVEDVLRSSIAEVELFERIDVGDLPELSMQGTVVTDVTHLLAELLDNATQFSEPSTRVSISAQETLEGVEIEIFDEGFGVNEHDLVELNERITNPPALDEAPSRLLGLFVVGRLAQQHGLDVELQSQPGVGTVATVFVPTSLFAESVEAAADRIETPSGYVAEAPVEAQEDQSAFLSGLEALAIDPATEAPSIEAPSIEAPMLEKAPTSDTSSIIEGLGREDPAIEAWEPAAVHEELLADASVPTMGEVEEAMPSFPGVTIDEPEPLAPPVNSVADDNWPMNKLDAAGPAQPSTAISQLDAMTPEVEAPAGATPAVEAPVMETPVVESPLNPEASPAPMAAPVVEPAATPEATPSAELPPVEPFSIAPPVPETDPVPAARRPLPAPPIVDAPAAQPAPTQIAPAAQPAPTQIAPAPPVAPAPAPVAAAPVAPAPVAEAPKPQPTFGGLPTRAPMATLESAQVTPELIPLENADAPATEETPKASASAFAAFATGVNRGLDKVKDDPESQFKNEGENT